MKEGWIVLNESICQNEYFGVYKSYKKAERRLRKVIRTRFGHCPKDLDRLAESEYTDDDQSSYKIVWFEENDGEEGESTDPRDIQLLKDKEDR